MAFTSTQSVQIILTVASVAAAVTWGEFLYIARRSERSAVPHRPPWGQWTWLERRARAGISAAAVLVVAVFLPALRFPSLLVLAWVTVSFARTTTFGREGSDEMALMVVVAMAVATAPWTGVMVVHLALVFIAAQLLLAYTASAGAKIAGRTWRDGTAVAKILSTSDFGIGRRGLYHSRSKVFRVLTWGAIALELAVPAGFILGGPFLIPAVALGAAFHLSVAAIMGLNRFVPWFLAAYPAAVWTSIHYAVLPHR